jgi:hypothetical protein
MIIDVTQVLKMLDGAVIKDRGKGGTTVDATLRMAIVNSLLAYSEKDNGIDKMQKYELAKKVFKNDRVELSSEDISLIKTNLYNAFSPLIAGQCCEMLEGKNSLGMAG